MQGKDQVSDLCEHGCVLDESEGSQHQMNCPDYQPPVAESGFDDRALDRVHPDAISDAYMELRDDADGLRARVAELEYKLAISDQNASLDRKAANTRVAELEADRRNLLVKSFELDQQAQRMRPVIDAVYSAVGSRVLLPTTITRALREMKEADRA